MYYKIVDKDMYFSINSDVKVSINLVKNTISKESDFNWFVFNDLYDLTEITYGEYNDALQHILDTLKINKFNFQFNGKK